MDEAEERLLVGVLIALTVTTGIVDAVSFLGLGQIFVSNTTGTLAILGFAIAGAPGLSVAASLTSLGAFVAGAALGGRLFRAPEAYRPWLLRAFALEAVLLAGAACLAIGFEVGADGFRRYALIAVLALAMGLRLATVRHLGVKDLNTSVVTLGMVGLVSQAPFAGGGEARAGRRFLAIGAILAGSLIGAVLVVHSEVVITIAAMAAIVVAIGAGYAYVSAPSRSRSTSPE